MAVAYCHGLPIAVCVENSSAHEMKLVDCRLVQMVTPEAPKNLIGDTAYDSDNLQAICAATMLAPLMKET